MNIFLILILIIGHRMQKLEAEAKLRWGSWKDGKKVEETLSLYVHICGFAVFSLFLLNF